MHMTDIGRGWLDQPAAASLARLERRLGRWIQITEAGRTWEQQNEHYQRFRRYGYPIALSPDGPPRGNGPSLHQSGNALDTDEHAIPGMVDLLAEYGWRRTVYRNGVLVEPWHFEYFINRDQHRYEPLPANATPAQPPVPEKEEDDMYPIIYAKASDAATVYEVKGGKKRRLSATEWALIKAAYKAAGQPVPYARNTVKNAVLEKVPSA